ncbi:MAG TPA: TVP38/TMEM64 family protein, partial [Verrucomicrobiales bacterium]|nr:TVP38/TMEM64 family protein [Verrucomicrobiales bacterium]
MAQDAGSLRMTTQPSNERLQVGWTKHFRRLSLVCLGGLLTAGWMIVRKSSLDWEWILEQEAVLTALTQDHFFASLAVVFIGYVLWAGLSIPGVTLVTLVVAWFYGFWVGLLLVSFASTAGATLAFLISRRLLQDWLKTRWQKRWMAFDESFRHHGNWFLFSLRLMPVIPFFLINLLTGCTSMRTHTYWWISQLGML